MKQPPRVTATFLSLGPYEAWLTEDRTHIAVGFINGRSPRRAMRLLLSVAAARTLQEALAHVLTHTASPAPPSAWTLH